MALFSNLDENNGLPLPYMGRCDYCEEEDVKVYLIGDDYAVCEDCLDEDFERCAICGEYYSIIFNDLTFFENGVVCEYCIEDLTEEERKELGSKKTID